MPLYDYYCADCDHTFEFRKGINAADPTCDVCGRAVKQVLSPPQLRFTGTGFYITDYPKGPKGKDS